MEELVKFCAECVPLSTIQLENQDNQRRLHSIAAMFLGMKDNVHRVLQAKTNGSCAITTRLEQWTLNTVHEARLLVKKLQEQPQELGFFAKGCLGFCAASNPNEEVHDRKMGEKVNTLLSKAFVIQAAIYHEETTLVVDIQKDTSVDSARQEFLGCVYDFNKRLASIHGGASQDSFKDLLAQVSGEYQKRQDVRTEAGKRAFIRWHKAANDMIKSQLQQKLSEREEELEVKGKKIEEVSVELQQLQKQNEELQKQLKNQNITLVQNSKEEGNQLALLQQENAQLAAQLAGKAEIELLLAEKEKKQTELNDELLKRKSEHEILTVSCTEAQKRGTELEKQLNTSKAAEAALSAEIITIKTELEAAKNASSGTTEKAGSLEKELAAKVAEIVVLKEKLTAAESHTANGQSDLETLRKQLKAKEEELSDAQKELVEMEDELKNLQAQVASYENERKAMAETMEKMTGELQAARDLAFETERKYKTWDAEMKALRDQLKEKQDETVRLLEHNVEIETTCRTLQEKISEKEDAIMKLEQRMAETEEETKRTIGEKTEAVDTLERKVKRLTNSLENTRKDLKSTKAELEEVQNKL